MYCKFRKATTSQLSSIQSQVPQINKTPSGQSHHPSESGAHAFRVISVQRSHPSWRSVSFRTRMLRVRILSFVLSRFVLRILKNRKDEDRCAVCTDPTIIDVLLGLRRLDASMEQGLHLQSSSVASVFKNSGRARCQMPVDSAARPPWLVRQGRKLAQLRSPPSLVHLFHDFPQREAHSSRMSRINSFLHQKIQLGRGHTTSTTYDVPHCTCGTHLFFFSRNEKERRLGTNEGTRNRSACATSSESFDVIDI